jgi:suppressor of ftsI
MKNALLTLFLIARGAFAQTPAPDLYSIELIASPELQRFTGVAELRPAASPFTTPVTRDGVHRYDVVITMDSLPDPRSLGDYQTFVVWAAPPTLRPMLKLGVLAPSSRAQTVGVVAFNRFTIFVTAERSADVPEPAGPFVMRGMSPSMRLGAAHVAQARPPERAHVHDTSGWKMPPPHPAASPMYMPALHGLSPNATPWLPAAPFSAAPLVKPRSFVRLRDRDSLRLEAGVVKRIVRGREVLMYGFNGEQPGPLLHVAQGATIHINFVNRTAHETAVHWHGVRLDNRFDGVPHVTQHPVAPGDSFRYQVKFRDAGIYWYHPHHREDIQQDLGLYGNMFVQERAANAYGRVHREEFVMLDDLLLGDDGLIPYGAERATHALMGRFGNVLLINGESASGYRLDVRSGEVVRFYFTNVANTRTFNLSIPGARLKVVASDIGRYEHEVWSESVVIAPAERYVIDVMFDDAGRVPILNSVQSIDHTRGTFFPETDTLGLVNVAAAKAQPDLKAEFGALRSHRDVISDVGKYRPHFTRLPDRTLTLTMKNTGLPFPLVQLLQRDTLFFNPVEWSGTMPMMDWLPTADQVTWTLRDVATGRDNEDITWKFKTGDLVRIRLINDRSTLHAMAHPIHIHGQRFLVLSVNGRETTNHVWKDTVLVPVGGIVELLLEVSNPGLWMIHCHIAEHLEAGMKMIFGVN